MFVNVNVCDFVCPSGTLPKAKFDGVMLNPGSLAVPVRGIDNVELVALLVIVTLPDTLPPLVGVSTALRVIVFPEVSMKGAFIPFTLKPAPLTLMLDICTGAVPMSFITIGIVALLSALTLPKLTDDGFACSRPNGAVDPVPASATFIVGVVGSLLVMDNVPLAAPAIVG